MGHLASLAEAVAEEVVEVGDGVDLAAGFGEGILDPPKPHPLVVLEDRIAGPRVAVTRLARGVPVGGELEYVDPSTLAQALRDRRSVRG